MLAPPGSTSGISCRPFSPFLQYSLGRWEDTPICPFNTSTLEVKIVGKTQPSSQWSVTGELRRRLIVAFKKEGIIAAKIPGAEDDKKK